MRKKTKRKEKLVFTAIDNPPPKHHFFIDRVIGYEKDDEKQEHALGKLLWLKSHPGHPDGDLKGYRRVKFYRARQGRWSRMRVQMIEEITRADTKTEIEAIELREILALLPYAARAEVLLAVAANDGRHFRKAGRAVREAIPEVIQQIKKELSS